MFEDNLVGGFKVLENIHAKSSMEILKKLASQVKLFFFFLKQKTKNMCVEEELTHSFSLKLNCKVKPIMKNRFWKIGILEGKSE